MKLQLFLLFVVLVLIVTGLRYFNDTLESVQVFHNRLMNYNWKPKQLPLMYCCLASILRINPRLNNGDVKFIYGYDYNYNQTIRGISFNNKDDVYLVFISTSNLDDTLSSLETQKVEIDQGMIHSGYHKRFHMGIYTSIMEILSQTKFKKIICIGHSLGGVMASLAGMYLNREFGFKTEVKTYGSPLWGNIQIKKSLDKRKDINIINYINVADPVIYKPRNRYIRVGKTISMKIDTGNDNVNHGIKVYRELVIGNVNYKHPKRFHRFDEVVSRKIMDLFL